MGKYNVKTLLKLRFLRLPVMRNFLVPAVVLVLMFLLPVASLEGARVVLLSTLLSAVTIPLWAELAVRFLT